MSTGLAEALRKKGIPDAEVGHELEMASSEHPLSVIRFRVTRPAVVVGKIDLKGITPEFQEPVRARAAKLQGARFAGGSGEGSTESRLLGPYFSRGFLDAQLRGTEVSVGPAIAGVVSVGIAGTVESGEAYRVGVLTFAATPLFSAEAFAATAKLHSGDLASQARLQESEEPVDAAYHKLGYMDAYVAATPARDESAHTVSYALRVVPGEVYHVRAIEVQGLPREAKVQFDQAWKLLPGQLYNVDYVKAFLTNNTAVRGLSGYEGSFQAAADPATHMVDLILAFHPMAGTKHD